MPKLSAWIKEDLQRVLSFVQKMCRQTLGRYAEDLQEDAVQDTFKDLMEIREKNPDIDIDTMRYFGGIAKNNSIDLIRGRTKNVRRLVSEKIVTQIPGSYSVPPLDDETSFDLDSLECNIQRLIILLPKTPKGNRWRQILSLARGGSRAIDIASELNCSSSTISKDRKELKKLIMSIERNFSEFSSYILQSQGERAFQVLQCALQNMQQKDIAQYLGIPPPRVSEVLKRIRQSFDDFFKRPPDGGGPKSGGPKSRGPKSRGTKVKRPRMDKKSTEASVSNSSELAGDGESFVSAVLDLPFFTEAGDTIQATGPATSTKTIENQSRQLIERYLFNLPAFQEVAPKRLYSGWLRVAAAITLVLASLFGYLGYERSSSESTQASNTATQGAAPSGDKVTITWLGAGPGASAEFEQKTEIAQFEQGNPHITVKYIQGPVSATDRYGLYLQNFQAQSAAVDVYQIDVIWPGDLAEHLLDLNQYGGQDAVQDDFPVIVTNNTVNGKLVGLPWFTDGGLLYYRTDLLQKYGYTAPPKTWAELTEMAKKVQDGERVAGNPDFWGFVWQGKAYEGLTCNALEWIYANGGGTIVSPDKKITINNEKAAAALDMAAGWIGTISPSGITGFQEEESRAVWQGGNAAFMRNWPYAYSLGQGANSKIVGKFAVTTLPAGDAGHGAATLGGWQLAVSKYSAHPAEAAKLALFLASKAQQKLRAIHLSLLPTHATLYDDPEVAQAAPFMPKLKSVFTNAVARPSTASAPKYNEVSTIFFQAVSQVLTKRSNGTDAVANMELDLKEKLGYDTGAP